jgi:hypothetical protein
MHGLIRKHFFDNIDIPSKWENTDKIIYKDGSIFEPSENNIVWANVSTRELSRKRYIIQGDKPFEVHATLEIILNINQGLGVKLIESKASEVIRAFNELDTINGVRFKSPRVKTIGNANGTFKKLVMVSFFYYE